MRGWLNEWGCGSRVIRRTLLHFVMRVMAGHNNCLVTNCKQRARLVTTAVLSRSGHNTYIVAKPPTNTQTFASFVQAELDAMRTQLAERTAAAETAQGEAAAATTALARLKQTHNAFKEEHADMRARCDAAVVTAAAATAASTELTTLRSKHEERAAEMTALQTKVTECVTRGCL
jgi:hypothetical protein